jgi:16S rRNA processing protein RimM
VLDVGRVVRPHGLNGQVVVELWTNRTERLDPGSRLQCGAGGGSLTVAKASPAGVAGGWPRWLVAFEGVASVEQAERLRDAVLQAEPVAVEGALWVHELIGATLHDPSGRPVGLVEAVEANPASDLLVLDDGRLVPLTFVSRDGEGRLTVDGPAGLLDTDAGEA